MNDLQLFFASKRRRNLKNRTFDFAKRKRKENETESKNRTTNCHSETINTSVVSVAVTISVENQHFVRILAFFLVVEAGFRYERLAKYVTPPFRLRKNTVMRPAQMIVLGKKCSA